MKKALLTLTILAVMASTAFAERGGYGNRQGQNKSWGQTDRRGGNGHPRGPMDEKTMDLMRAHYTIIRDMGRQIREEADETKKAEMIAELRVKLNTVADLMVEKQEKRLAHAEERLDTLKDRIISAKTDREAMIDEKIERILAGKGPKRHDTDAFKNHPYAKGGRGGDRGSRGGYGMRDGSGPGPRGETPPPPIEEDATHPPEDDAPPPSAD